MASLRAAYPEITGPVSDWHAYNRTAQRITVAPYPDLPLTFRRTALKDEDRYVTWFGTVPEIPGSTLVAVAGPSGSQTSVLIMPGSTQYTFVTAPDGTTNVIGADPGDEGCGNSPSTPNRTGSVSKTTPLQYKVRYSAAADLATAAGFGSAQEVGMPAKADANTIFVDVLFLYNATAKQSAAYLNAADPVGYLDTYAKACLESGNVVLNNSQVTNLQWRYLGIEAVPEYTEKNVATDPLDAISPDGAIGSWVTTEAYKKGADIVHYFWSSRTNTTAGYSGIANSAGNGKAVDANRARAVSTFAADSTHSPASYKTVIHEWGHLEGADHDRAHSGASTDNPTGNPAKDGDGLYGYGMLWNSTFHNPNTGGDFPVSASTVMGYGQAVIPYFSNPGISVDVTFALADYGNGLPVDFGTQVLGVALDQRNAAYNAKVLVDNASTIAAFNEPITTPAITAQPQGASVVVGNGFSLSVTATGGGLTYQWYLGGVAISGATAAVYSKSNSATSDAGDYTVSASNSLGSVTSSSATVTVTTPPPPPPPGGGGGGGAPSNLFLASILLLAVMRSIACSRRIGFPSKP